MKRKIVMGIDVGTSTVKTVIAEMKQGNHEPYILGAGISPSHGLRKGCIINQHDAANTIKNSVKKAQEAAKVEIKDAFVSLGGVGMEGVRSKGSIAVAKADHEVTENDIKRAISQSEAQLSRNSSSYLLNREIIHTFPINYKIDEEIIIGNPIGMKGEKLEVETLFVTAPSQYLASLLKSMQIADINVKDIYADSLAMSHLLLGHKEKEVGCLLLNVGGDTSSLAVFEEGCPISFEIFPIGSNHITYDIARGFQVLLAEAEDLKISYGCDNSIKKKLAGIIEPRLNDIFELVDNHLNKIKRSQLLPGGIIITGGGANLEGIEELAKKTLRLPTQLNPTQTKGNLSELAKDPSWSVAAGLCYAGLINDNEINLASKGILSKTKKTLLSIFKNFLP